METERLNLNVARGLKHQHNADNTFFDKRTQQTLLKSTQVTTSPLASLGCFLAVRVLSPAVDQCAAWQTAARQHKAA
jgi:hypothetical protein